MTRNDRIIVFITVTAIVMAAMTLRLLDHPIKPMEPRKAGAPYAGATYLKGTILN